MPPTSYSSATPAQTRRRASSAVGCAEYSSPQPPHLEPVVVVAHAPDEQGQPAGPVVVECRDDFRHVERGLADVDQTDRGRSLGVLRHTGDTNRRQRTVDL
jgi:hypothetical protein